MLGGLYIGPMFHFLRTPEGAPLHRAYLTASASYGKRPITLLTRATRVVATVVSDSMEQQLELEGVIGFSGAWCCLPVIVRGHSLHFIYLQAR